MPKIARILVVVALGAAVLAPAAAWAGKPSGGGTTASGTCAESPNPVAVGSGYVISGSHLPANQIVGVTVSDPKGTQVGSVLTSSTGTMTYYGVASVVGAYSAHVTTSGRKPSTVASCSFQAR